MSSGFMFWLWTLLTGSKLKAYHFEGHRLLAADRKVAAINLYREMLRQWPDQPDGYLGLSQAYRAMGLRPEAIREAKIGEALAQLQKNPDDLAYRIDLASGLIEKEQFSRAAAHLDYALKLAPKDKELLKLAAHVFIKNRNYERAVTALIEVTRQEPLQATHYEKLAKSQGSLRLTQQAVRSGAIAEALKAVDADPGNAEMVDRAIRQFIAGGFTDRALILVERCLKGHEDNAGLQRLMGEMLLNDHQSQQAITALKLAVSLDPTDIKAHSLLGQTYQREGNKEMAEHHLGLVRTIDLAKQSKDPIDASIAMVRVLIDSGNQEQALQQAENVCKEYADDWRAPYALGMALRAQGKVKEAITQLQKAMSQNCLAPEPHLEMASLQSDLGEILEAVGEARKAVNLSPRDPEIRRVLASVLRTHGFADQAVEEEELAEAFSKKA